MPLWGVTSTSMSRDEALNFAENDESKGKKAVLYHIKWRIADDCLMGMSYMDEKRSVFPHEKEILLSDGAMLIVGSVKK